MNLSSRREFLVAGAVFPFFERHPDHVSIAGIRFRVVRRGKSRHRYLHIHGSETTAREILMEQIDAHGGTAVLTESTQRYVILNGGRLDPNRMFSHEGATRNLKMLNRQWTDAQIIGAASALEHDRNKFVNTLKPPKGGRIVALHNNSAGYSVENEIAISDRTSLKDASNPHEFFLATDAHDYEILSRSPYNVVMQNAKPTEDDGSLSRLAAHLAIRYINLECGLGKIDRQREMLGWLEANL